MLYNMCNDAKSGVDFSRLSFIHVLLPNAGPKSWQKFVTFIISQYLSKQMI